MMEQLTYAMILAGSLAGPLLLSFDRKVAFYKKWKWVFTAMILPAAGYIAWDMIFTSNALWSFNTKYILGTYIRNIPLEEVLFFFVVPYCCMFIYACVNYYFKFIKKGSWGLWMAGMLFVSLVILGLIYNDRLYTMITFMLAALFIAISMLLKRIMRPERWNAFFVAYAIILIPFLIVNGLLTRLPVVIYNSAETMGIRIFTIPVEDSIYGMLLFLLNVVVYESIRPVVSTDRK